MLEDIFVPLGICVAMPVLIVWLIGRVRQNEINRKAEIMLKAIDAGAEINPDLLQREKKPKSLKERLIRRLSAAVICSLFGITLLLNRLINMKLPDFGSVDIVTAGFFISVGIGLFISYFAGKKLLAKEMEAE